MKTKTYLIVFWIPYILYSQMLEPTQQTFNYYSLSQGITLTNVLLNPENIDFKQDSIIIGYQWNSGRRISDGLLFNQDDIDEIPIFPLPHGYTSIGQPGGNI